MQPGIMDENKSERKVTVILAADVVGYSTSMEENEEQTLKNLKACRDIIEGLISDHHGRIFNTAGDSVLAEFQSAVEAVICASEFQKNIKERNGTVLEVEQMQFRVGINMGDVVIEGENLYGEGVNVAARLEALAQPGGICLSKNVHEIVHKKTDFQFHDLGEQKVKNTVLHAVDITLEGITQRKLSKSQQIKRSDPWKKYLAAVLITALIVGGGVWWQLQPDFEPADKSKFAYKLPDKPSIAVLPFNNMSGDPSQDYLGDGLSENIIAVLSTSPYLFVIARNSSFTFKGKSTKVQEVSEQLGVRYVLEGSVQQSGEKLRVTAQLVDALDGKNLWAERFDRKLNDLFAVQDEITNKISEQMQVQLIGGEQHRSWYQSSSPDEMRLILKAREHFHAFTRDGHRKAEKIFLELLERYPEGGLHNLNMGWVNYQKIVMRLTKNPKENIKLGRQFGEKAHEIMGDGTSLTMLARFDLFERDCESAVKHVDQAVEIDPSAGLIMAMAGRVNSTCGKPEKAIEQFKQAMRLEPYHLKWYPLVLGLSYMMTGNYNKAEEYLKALVETEKLSKRNRTRALRHMAVLSVFKEESENAKKYFHQLIELDKKHNLSSVKFSYRAMKDQEFLKRYLDSLRQLGMPEKKRTES